MSQCPPNVPRPPVSVNQALSLPEIAQAVSYHAPSLQRRLLQLFFVPPRVTRTWKNHEGKPVVDISIACDEQSDTFLRDQREATNAARDALIQVGFVVLVTGLGKLRITSYYGSREGLSAEKVA
jgi:hypothetical protein